MANYLIILLFAIIVLATAKPVPDYEQDGQEILKGSDARYYGVPFFWYRRPLTGDDGDDYGANDGGYIRPAVQHHHHQDSIPLYETAGAGWGR